MPRRRKRILKTNPGGSVEELCAICFGTIGDGELMVTPCQHGFHRSCLEKWPQQNICPVDWEVIDSAEVLKVPEALGMEMNMSSNMNLS